MKTAKQANKKVTRTEKRVRPAGVRVQSGVRAGGTWDRSVYDYNR